MVSLYRDPKGEKIFSRTVSTWIHHTVNFARSEQFAAQQDSTLRAEITEREARLFGVRLYSEMTIIFPEFCLMLYNIIYAYYTGKC